MTKFLIVCMLSWMLINSNDTLPDGTLVFSSKPGTTVGNVAKRMAGRAQGAPARYTHVGIVLNGLVYELDYPEVKIKTIHSFKRNEIVDYYIPTVPYTKREINNMLSFANSKIGQPYRLRGFIKRNGQEGWCSTFAGQVLMHGGKPNTLRDRFTPDLILKAVESHYVKQNNY